MTKTSFCSCKLFDLGVDVLNLSSSISER